MQPGFSTLLAFLELSQLIAQRVQIDGHGRLDVLPVLWRNGKQSVCGVGVKQRVHDVSNRHVTELRWV